MNFKEECLKLYEKIGERHTKENLKRLDESRRRNRSLIIKRFEGNFEISFKEEYLIEVKTDYTTIFHILIDDIKILVSFQDRNWPRYYLMVKCHKCGKETTYGNYLNHSFKHDIGRILNEDPKTSYYRRICGECDGKRKDLEREQRDARYEKQMKERNGDIIKRFADVIADILREGGYRDLYNYDEEPYES